MKGYVEAETINNRIRKWQEEDPITRDNALRWMNFLRTVQIELNRLTTEAYNVAH